MEFIKLNPPEEYSGLLVELLGEEAPLVPAMSVLGDDINEPGGYQLYGGATVTAFQDAAGWVFWSFCGKRPDGKFLQLVFRQLGTAIAIPVTLPEEVGGRGSLCLEPWSGLYLVAWTGAAGQAVRWRLDEFQTPTMAGNGAPVEGDVSALIARLEAAERRIAELEARPSVVDVLQTATQAVNIATGAYNKAKLAVDDLWGKFAPRVEALEQRPGGVSRDDVWALAGDRVYADLGNAQSGISSRVGILARAAVGALTLPSDLTALINGVARANEQVNSLGNRVVAVETELQKRPTEGDLFRLWRKWTDIQWENWVTYTDKRLLNLLWDRAVKLLRYKERTGKTAEQLPVNDPKNLEV